MDTTSHAATRRWRSVWALAPAAILLMDVTLVWRGLPPRYHEPAGLMLSVALSCCIWWALFRLSAAWPKARYVTLWLLPCSGLLLASAWQMARFTAFPGVTVLVYLAQEPLSAMNMASAHAARPLPWLGLLAGAALAALWWQALRRIERPTRSERRVAALAGGAALCLALAMPDGAYSNLAPYVSDVRLWSALGHGTKQLLDGGETQLPRVMEREAARLDPPNAASPRFDVLVVLTESLRPDRLSAYGYTKRETTPHLQAFTKEHGEHLYRFDRAHSNSAFTSFSLTSIFTGLSIDRPMERLSRRALMWHVAQRLGLKTFYLTVHNLAWGHVEDFLFSDSPPEVLHDAQSYGAKLVNDTGAHDAFLIDDVSAQIEALKERDRFFGVVHTNATHYPFLPSETTPWATGGAANEARYDGAVRLTDEVFGGVIAALERSGRLERTMIVFLSDHGEHLYDSQPVDATGQGRLRANSCHPAIARIPLLIYAPPALELSEAMRQNLSQNRARAVSTLDVLPTLMQAWGLRPDEELDGRSLFEPIDPGRATRCLSPGSSYPKDFLGFSLFTPEHVFYERRDYPHTERFSPLESKTYEVWESGAALTPEEGLIFEALVREQAPELQKLKRSRQRAR